MRVKIGNVVYDPGYQPIMVILDEGDGEDLAAHIAAGDNLYCQFPPHMNEDEVEAWMDRIPE